MMESTADLILRLARESEASDSGPRPAPIELLNRAMDWSEPAEEAGAAVMVNAGHTLAHPSAPIVCAAVEYGMRHGRKARVGGFQRWAGRSRRAIAERLRTAGLPATSELIRIGVCVRTARALDRAGRHRGRCTAAVESAGFADISRMSQYLYRHMGVRPSNIREARPVAIAARVLAKGGAHAD